MRTFGALWSKSKSISALHGDLVRGYSSNTLIKEPWNDGRDGSLRFWRERSNQQRYLNWLGDKLGWEADSLNWYSLDGQTLISNHGSNLLSHFSSVDSLLSTKVCFMKVNKQLFSNV